MKKQVHTILLLILLLIGLSLLLYPSVSNYWNSLHQSKAIVDYEAALKEMAEADYTALFADAEAYNRQIRTISYPLMNCAQVPGYEDVLNVSGTGIMGYIHVPKIDVKLPIYHGTSESVLQASVGHLEGTTLPIGGEGNHCVLSAHRGLPSAELFTDLDKMEIGDTFSLTVLDRILTYQVDQILIVEPREVEALYPVDGKDHCTLITCTPYGVNSHRMLVRGIRVDTPEVKNTPQITADATKMTDMTAAAILSAPIFLILLFVLLIKPTKQKEV